MSSGPSTLGIMMTSSAVADLGHRRGQVVEPPGRVERVDPGPELGVAEVGVLGHLDQPGAGGLLVGGGHAVLEVGQQHVDLGRHVGHLGHHLGVGGREEVDHPRRAHRDLAERLGGADGERSEEVLGVAHRRDPRTRPGRRREISRPLASPGNPIRRATGWRESWHGCGTHGGATKQRRRGVPARAAGGLRLRPPRAADLRRVGRSAPRSTAPPPWPPPSCSVESPRT